MVESMRFSLEINGDVTGKLRSIAAAARECSKAMEELRKKSREVNGQYRDLSKRSAAAAQEAQAVKKTMEEMAESMQKSGDEAEALKFDRLREQYEGLRAAAAEYAEAAQGAAKDARALAEESRKTGGGGGSDRGGRSGGGLWGNIGRTGWVQQVGGALGNYAGAHLESRLGEEKGSAVGGILSGAAQGAAGGMAMFGLWGAAAGAVIGGVSGWINAEAQKFEEEDDAFKDYYKSLHQEVSGAAEEERTAGSAEAAEREQTKLALAGLAGGGAADKLLEQLGDMAGSTGLTLDSLTETARTMLKAGTAADDVVPVLTKVEGAGLALGLADGDVGTAAALLGRMQTKKQTSAGELEQLEQLGLDVFGWLAEALETDEAGVRKAVSEGGLTGGEAAEILLERMGTLYGAALEGQAASTAGLDSRLQGLKEDIGAAGGEAYNELRSESKAQDIAAYGGALGDKLAELSAVSGRTAAYGENLRDQFQREALSAVLLDELDEKSTVFAEEQVEALRGLREEYAAAEEEYNRDPEGNLEAGLTMQRLKEEAEALAKAAYESSDWYQKELEAELDEIDAIRELTKTLKARTNALKVQREYEKGINGNSRNDEKNLENAYATVDTQSALGFGLDYVPYDGFPALLHEGERVLTAEAARRMDRGGGGVSVTVTGNAFHVRQASDIDEIAEALARKLRSAALRGGI